MCSSIEGKGKGGLARLLQNARGQATVEAAYLIPVIFVLLLLLVQPGILLYNRMVMMAAASEGCRLLATKTDVAGMSEEKCEGYILRRLGSVPQQENFHMHEGGCSWEVDMEGDEGSMLVRVSIRNSVKLLPLLDMGGALLGLADGNGVFEQAVSVSMPVQPDWVSSSAEGLDPPAWVEKWK